MKKKAVGRIAVIVILLLVACYCVIVIANNRIASGLEADLRSYPLPERTQLLDSISIAGKVAGNGNGMQYLGAILVKSDLSKEELLEYYQGGFKGVAVVRQQTPLIFDYYNYKFGKFDENAVCYRIELWINTVVGFEDSFWQEILNSDIRGH